MRKWFWVILKNRSGLDFAFFFFVRKLGFYWRRVVKIIGRRPRLGDNFESKELNRFES